ncbi:hypothetical protein LOTGIDRAFT_166072 [Lottia gigantea]|uniref:Uncharacterized protein n=1 Tax=Lottia gigantea TaxID=225164 RepID=V4BHG2_LOTGI|nr:hypothetical protein LOTGIDRAFT_166072 [Lottia gigantea]ESO88044.1 hypothetical protein LOTGIDRAFT_166072 [Lottia gigantea]
MDKRNILHSSKYRSGAPELENNENQPPPVLTKTKVIDKAVEGGQKSLNFGSNVSKIKEMFQAGGSGTGQSKSILTPPPSVDVDRSPVSKKQKMSNSPERRRTVSEPKLDNVTPEQPDPTLLEATNHVQRFNYTRALFARMEAENTQTDGQSKPKTGYRKSSPSRVLPRSPVLSPLSSGPTSPEPKSFSTLDFSTSSRLSRRDISSNSLAAPSISPRERSNSDQSRNRGSRDYSNRSRNTSDSNSETTESLNNSEVTRKISSSSEASSHNSPRSVTSDSAVEEGTITKTYLRKKLQNEQVEEGSRDRTGKVFTSLSKNNNNSSEPSDGSKTGSNVSPLDRVGKLNLRSNLNQNQNEASNRLGHRSRLSLDSTSSHSKDSDQRETSCVKLRTGSTRSDVEPNRRLSRDDIQAAMAKADAYLAHLGAPKSSTTDSPNKRRSWNPHEAQNEISSSNKRRSWDPRDFHGHKTSTEEHSADNVNTSDVVNRMKPSQAAPIQSKMNNGSLTKDSDIEIDDSIVSVKTPSLTKPIPVPKRTAPPPPSKPPPYNSSVSRPLAPPPPAPKPGLREEKKKVEPEVSTSESMDYEMSNGETTWPPNNDPPAYKGQQPPSYEEATREADAVMIVENTDLNTRNYVNII